MAVTKTFWADATDSLAMPFRGNGPMILLVATIGAVGLQILASLPLVSAFTFAGGVFYGAWLMELFVSTLEETCRGEDVLPSPSLTGGSATWGSIFARMMTIFGTLAWSAVPWMAYRLTIWLWHPLLGESGDSLMLWGLLGLGAFLWPMTILTATILGLGADSLRHDRLLLSIARMFGPYVVIWVMVFAALAGWVCLPMMLAAFRRHSESYPGFGAIGIKLILLAFISAAQTYLLLVAMRLIGLLYRHYKHKLPWVAE